MSRIVSLECWNLESPIHLPFPPLPGVPHPGLKGSNTVNSWEQCSLHPGWLGYIGDEKLPAYMGIVS